MEFPDPHGEHWSLTPNQDLEEGVEGACYCSSFFLHRALMLRQVSLLMLCLPFSLWLDQQQAAGRLTTQPPPLQTWDMSVTLERAFLFPNNWFTTNLEFCPLHLPPIGLAEVTLFNCNLFKRFVIKSGTLIVLSGCICINNFFYQKSFGNGGKFH